MSTIASAPQSTAQEIEVLRHQARMTEYVVRLNTEGVSHEESLIQPPAGNCMNWIVGHLLAINEKALRVLGQPTVMPPEALTRYDRGAAPIVDQGEAIDFAELVGGWTESCRRMDAGYAGLAPEVLDRAAPSSPSGNPNETFRTLLTTIAFHQAYHAGQTGVLRRIVGKDGAVR